MQGGRCGVQRQRRHRRSMPCLRRRRLAGAAGRLRRQTAAPQWLPWGCCRLPPDPGRGRRAAAAPRRAPPRKPPAGAAPVSRGPLSCPMPPATPCGAPPADVPPAQRGPGPSHTQTLAAGVMARGDRAASVSRHAEGSRRAQQGAGNFQRSRLNNMQQQSAAAIKHPYLLTIVPEGHCRMTSCILGSR